jgi:hypothetical protein
VETPLVEALYISCQKTYASTSLTTIVTTTTTTNTFNIVVEPVLSEKFVSIVQFRSRYFKNSYFQKFLGLHSNYNGAHSSIIVSGTIPQARGPWI